MLYQYQSYASESNLCIPPSQTIHRQDRTGRIFRKNFRHLIPFTPDDPKPTNRYPLKYTIFNILHIHLSHHIRMLSALPRTLARSSLKAGGVVRPVALGMSCFFPTPDQIRHCPESSTLLYQSSLSITLLVAHHSSLVLRTRDSLANSQASDSTPAPELTPTKPNLSKHSTTDTLHSLQTVPTYSSSRED